MAPRLDGSMARWLDGLDSRTCYRRNTPHWSTLEWGKVTTGVYGCFAQSSSSLNPPYNRCAPHSPLDGDFLQGTREDGV